MVRRCGGEKRMNNTIWEDKETKEIVLVLSEALVMTTIEGKWLSGISYRKIEGSTIYVRMRDNFMKKYIRKENQNVESN